MGAWDQRTTGVGGSGGLMRPLPEDLQAVRRLFRGRDLSLRIYRRLMIAGGGREILFSGIAEGKMRPMLL